MGHRFLCFISLLFLFFSYGFAPYPTWRTEIQAKYIVMYRIIAGSETLYWGDMSSPH